jgi:hypothetical protein
MFCKNIINKSSAKTYTCQNTTWHILVNKTMELFSNANIALQTAYGHIPNRQMTKQASG